VAPPVEVTITVRASGADTLSASIDGYVDATIRLGRAYPPPPAADLEPLVEERPSPVAAADFYRERWMFHGPSYQGVVNVGAIAPNGIRGTLRTGDADGALMDNAGQLFGFWVMLNAERDRLAMPVRIRRLDLFGPHPSAGDLCDCTVRIRKLDAGSVRADIDITAGGAIWARIEGWEDRRFETDDALWRVLREPEHHALAVVQADGYVLLRDRWRTAQSRDFLMRRYLSDGERAEYEALRPMAQRQWLAGRIAAKDAVRQWMWTHGSGPLFPVEIQVANEQTGRPVVRGACPEDLNISIAHKNDLAVALAGAGRAVGIDIEHVAPRDAGFEAIAFTAREREMLPAIDRDEWIARFWSAKEAAAKARGTGLAGNPAGVEIGERRGDVLVVDGTAIQTRLEGEYVVAFTTE
jgi:phosphopantetheinyl transferase